MAGAGGSDRRGVEGAVTGSHRSSARQDVGRSGTSAVGRPVASISTPQPARHEPLRANTVDRRTAALEDVPGTGLTEPSVPSPARRRSPMSPRPRSLAWRRLRHTAPWG